MMNDHKPHSWHVSLNKIWKPTAVLKMTHSTVWKPQHSRNW